MAFSKQMRPLCVIALVLAFLLLFGSTAAFAADAVGEVLDPSAAAPLDTERVPEADDAPLGSAPAADEVLPEDAAAADGASLGGALAADGAPPENAPAADEVLPDGAPVNSSPPEALPQNVTERFADVLVGAWYVEDVQWVFAAGIMTGYDGTSEFGVGDTLTRAQLAALLAKYAGADTSSEVDETGIADVAAGGQWYTGAVNWAVEAGIITGYDNSDGTKRFAPDDPVTRQQAMTILMRLAEGRGLSVAAPLSALNSFADAPSVAGWADAAVAWAIDRGVVSGVDRSGKRWIEPGRAVLREEMAKMMRRVVDGLESGFPASEGAYTNWKKAEDGWRYRTGFDSWATGWQDIDGARYYFDENGFLHTGWLSLAEGRFYLMQHGPMATGWLDMGSSRYYLGEDGVAFTGWHEIDGAWRDFAADGRLKAQLGRQEWINAVDKAASGKKVAVAGGAVDAAALAAVQADVDAIAKKGYSVGFVMLDLNTGAIISCNAWQAYYGASAIKGSYACAVAADQPTKAARYKGAIEAAVNRSSNSDYLHLRELFGSDPMRTWMKEADVDYFSAGSTWPTMRSVDLAKLWVRNHEFLCAGKGAASWLAPYFQDTTRSYIDAAVGGRHAVYSKAGWIWDGPKWFVWNDAGYVDKEGAPYVLAVMSSANNVCAAELESLVAHVDVAHDSLLSSL